MTMKRSTQGVELRTERLRVGEVSVRLLHAGSGPRLLFLHAAGGGGWTPFLDELSRSFEVLAPDHPGFDESEQTEEMEGVDDLVYHYLRLLDLLGIDSAIVVGASLGGWIAAELAVHSPHRVDRLVLMSPAGLRIPEAPPLDLFLLPPERIVETLFHDPRAAAGLFPEEPSIDQILRAYHNNAAFARYALRPYLNDPKLERRLYRIAAPTLVLWPDDDRVIPRAHAERYAERIAEARLEIIADCGHVLDGERPQEITQAVLAFLGVDTNGRGSQGSSTSSIPVDPVTSDA
jgi:pimeloyl-ACP methyl ester carboxylesterase